METSEPALPLSENDEELLELVASIQKGEQVDHSILLLRDRLKGLIKKIKDGHSNSAVISDEEAFDLCMLPIYEATMNFNLSKKIRFTTYVFYYIQSALYSEINERNGIVERDRIKRLVPKVLQIINEYIQENEGKEPSNDIIQETLVNEGMSVSIEDVESCRSIYFMNAPEQIVDDEGRACSIFDTIAASSSDSHFDKSIEDILEIAEVSERERRVFLLKEKSGMKLKEIADIEGVSVSVIARIINRVKAKIWRKGKELGYEHIF